MDETQMTLATNWARTDLRGWFCSEKLDGCRAFWDGKEFWTRGGNRIDVPDWFVSGLPTIPLDGEIWAGRDTFQIARVAVQNGAKWFDDTIKFMVFDSPDTVGTWDKRMGVACKSLKSCKHAAVVDFWRISHPSDFADYMKKIYPLGGEGVMFRNPEITTYETGRSENLLRFKFIRNKYARR